MSQQGASRARRVVSKPLAELVNRALDPLIARRGFGEATLLTQWDMIVGARIGALCQPMRLNWPPRPKNGRRTARRTPLNSRPRWRCGSSPDLASTFSI